MLTSNHPLSKLIGRKKYRKKMTMDEKIQKIKDKYHLYHGPGKRKKKKKRK